MLAKFWQWYEGKYKIALHLTTILFLIQVIHLYWMTTDIVMLRLYGHEFWNVSSFWQTAIAIADYTEIPAIISASVFYAHQMRDGFNQKSFSMLLLINSQWIHLFWITDEVIYAQFTGTALVLIPVWLSWIAIGIDYLEIPVMYDTVLRSLKMLKKNS